VKYDMHVHLQDALQWLKYGQGWDAVAFVEDDVTSRTGAHIYHVKRVDEHVDGATVTFKVTSHRKWIECIASCLAVTMLSWFVGSGNGLGKVDLVVLAHILDWCPRRELDDVPCNMVPMPNQGA
jgi:hypothetical protein